MGGRKIKRVIDYAGILIYIQYTMYVLAVYQHYSLKVDMDHVTRLRKMVRELGYEECMEKLDNFQNQFYLCLTEKCWVLDLFGEYCNILPVVDL